MRKSKTNSTWHEHAFVTQLQAVEHRITYTMLYIARIYVQIKLCMAYVGLVTNYQCRI